jgi:hypothetical protein
VSFPDDESPIKFGSAPRGLHGTFTKKRWVPHQAFEAAPRRDFYGVATAFTSLNGARTLNQYFCTGLARNKAL